jgi:hypothetical protein
MAAGRTEASFCDELSEHAETPRCVSAVTWSCISAMSGETTMAGLPVMSGSI